MLTRRDLIRLSGSAAALAMLPVPAFALPLAGAASSASQRLFFNPVDVPRIRATAASPMLSPTLDAWAVEGLGAARVAIEKVAMTGEKIRDFAAALERLTEQGVLHIIDPTPRREAVLLDGIDTLLDLPTWDYFLSGDTPMGIQRASAATERLLFLREVLGDDLEAAREARLLSNIAEKGCAPCALTLSGMENPETGRDWHMDEQHAAYLDIDMTRWPEILGANNLRAAPMSALGIGALALQGHDPRADGWLEQAIRNARICLDFFDPDGTYFEGVSYADYTLRSLFAFFDAHQRADPAVRWADEVNLEGMVRFALAMQAGRQDDGTPDVVNFSDANGSTSYCVPAWVARQLEDTSAAGVAQFAVERTSRPGSFYDVLWTDPDRALAFPPESYHNVRLDNDWVVCRTGWAADDSVLAFRSGGPANHEHADRNSFLFKAHGERLLTDIHGAAYDWRQPKWLLRQTEAHNAMLIDGQGHQYHNGEEGTNESLAESEILRFEDDGDRVWWTSDATAAYALVNDALEVVRRTVLFAKPDVIVLFDEIEADDVGHAVRPLLPRQSRPSGGAPHARHHVLYRAPQRIPVRGHGLEGGLNVGLRPPRPRGRVGRLSVPRGRRGAEPPTRDRDRVGVSSKGRGGSAGRGDHTGVARLADHCRRRAREHPNGRERNSGGGVALVSALPDSGLEVECGETGMGKWERADTLLGLEDGRGLKGSTPAHPHTSHPREGGTRVLEDGAANPCGAACDLEVDQTPEPLLSHGERGRHLRPRGREKDVAPSYATASVTHRGGRDLEAEDTLLHTRHHRLHEGPVTLCVRQHDLEIEHRRIRDDAVLDELDGQRALEPVRRQRCEKDGVVHVGLLEERHLIVAAALEVDMDDVLAERAVVGDGLRRAREVVRLEADSQRVAADGLEERSRGVDAVAECVRVSLRDQRHFAFSIHGEVASEHHRPSDLKALAASVPKLPANILTAVAPSRCARSMVSTSSSHCRSRASPSRWSDG